jgi:hypothetical protein
MSPQLSFGTLFNETFHVPNTKQKFCQCSIPYIKLSQNTPNTKQQKHPLPIGFLPFPNSMNIQPPNTTKKTLQMYNDF